MGASILAGRDRLSLDNGMDLRLLSALEVLQARREAGELAQEDRERALCSNACLLARALEHTEDQRPVFADGRAVLACPACRARALEERCPACGREREQWGENMENAAFDWKRFEALRGGGGL